MWEIWNMPRKPKTLSKNAEKQIKNLGKRIEELRKKKGYTNYEVFSYEHGLARSQYGLYERGSDMTFSSILKIVEAHGMTIKEFFSQGFE